MTSTLRRFVEQHEVWFRGRGRETDATLDTAERELGVQLPAEIRALLRDYGYWHATGISSLDETVERTVAAREHIGLPARFVVLYDHHDGGVILLDTIADPGHADHRVYNVGWDAVPDRMADEIVYDSYLDYVRSVLEDQRATTPEEYVKYDPSAYREP